MSDEQNSLAARAKRGDRAALNDLLESHLRLVYRFVSVKMGSGHPELDDIVQETLIGASTSIRTLRGESNAQVAAWLLSIARHKVADHLRARYTGPHESLQSAGGAEIVDAGTPVDEQVVAIQRAERLRQAMNLLTPEQEEVLTLRFVLGFGIDEVAAITRRPPGAVKSMQHRALASLHQKLRAEEAAWN
jgi:RNA polymerase sigma-70 factor (ECF subfamily)